MQLLYVTIIYSPAFLALFMGLGLLTSRSSHIRALAFVVPIAAISWMVYAVFETPHTEQFLMGDMLKMEVFFMGIVVMILLAVEFVIRPIARFINQRAERAGRPTVLA